MSEKKAKQERREEGQRKQVGTVEIDVFDNGTVEVRNFPQNAFQTMFILAKAQERAVNHFALIQAMESQKRIIHPDINTVAQLNKKRPLQ